MKPAGRDGTYTYTQCRALIGIAAAELDTRKLLPDLTDGAAFVLNRSLTEDDDTDAWGQAWALNLTDKGAAHGVTVGESVWLGDVWLVELRGPRDVIAQAIGEAHADIDPLLCEMECAQLVWLGVGIDTRGVPRAFVPDPDEPSPFD